MWFQSQPPLRGVRSFKLGAYHLGIRGWGVEGVDGLGCIWRVWGLRGFGFKGFKAWGLCKVWGVRSFGFWRGLRQKVI